jgi:predicted DsbA family dithiol-disulfide isomerase
MGAMLVEIYSDTVCPWCYLGKRRFEQALARRPGLEVEVRWLPFELNPAMPEGGVPREEYLASKFGDTEVLRRAQARLTTLGRADGIEYRFDLIRLSPNTRAAHALSRIAAEAGCQDAVQESLFRAYFVEGQDIGDLDVLVGIAAAGGLDAAAVRERLQSRRDWPELAGIEREAGAAGVSGVPFFVFDRKYAVSGAQETAVFERILDHVVAAARPGAR